MTMTNGPALSATRKPDGPVGIGGWLILPIIGLCGTILLTGYNVFSVLGNGGVMSALIAGSNPTAVALRLPMGLSGAMGIGIMILAGICLYRIFTYSPSVPKLMTAFYIVLVAVTLVEAFLGKMVADTAGSIDNSDNLSDILRVVLGAAIWIPYFNVSRRVANTFRSRRSDANGIGEVF